jgi:hypothetical protein
LYISPNPLSPKGGDSHEKKTENTYKRVDVDEDGKRVKNFLQTFLHTKDVLAIEIILPL